MNTLDFLEQRDITYLSSLQCFSEPGCHIEGECGFWSLKNRAIHEHIRRLD